MRDRCGGSATPHKPDSRYGGVSTSLLSGERISSQPLTRLSENSCRKYWNRSLAGRPGGLDLPGTLIITFSRRTAFHNLCVLNQQSPACRVEFWFCPNVTRNSLRVQQIERIVRHHPVSACFISYGVGIRPMPRTGCLSPDALGRLMEGMPQWSLKAAGQFEVAL
jgi:hypothetical protein